MMDKFELFEAAGQVDDDLLEDAEGFLQRSEAKRPRPWVKWGAMAACLTVAACALWALGTRDPVGPVEPADPSASEELLPTVSQPVDSVSPEQSGQITRPVVQVDFNELAEAPSPGETYGAWLGLMGEDFVPMTREELLDYYGAALPVEEVLPDLTAVGPKEDSGYGRGIYRSEDRGVYFDTSTFTFRSADEARGVSVAMDTTGYYPSPAIELPGDTLAFTLINGWELALFRYSNESGDDCQYVEFLQDGVRYHVRGKNLSGQEFAAVLEALLEERSDYAPGEARTFQGEVTYRIVHEVRTTTEADGSSCTEEFWYGPLGVQLDGDEGRYLRVGAAEGEAERWAGIFDTGDRVEVAFVGEPATIGTVWPQQRVSLTKVEE